MRKKERPALGQRLTELREAAGLTQVQLAERVAVHPSNIGFWELSGTPPRGEVLPKLADVPGKIAQLQPPIKTARALAGRGLLPR